LQLFVSYLRTFCCYCPFVFKLYYSQQVFTVVFSPAFASQIESKVVAFQKYLTEQNNLLAVKVIANQTVVHANATARSNVVKANGESQTIRIITSQLKQNPEYLQWLSINRWNGQLPYALGSGAVPFVQLPLLQPSQIQNQTHQTQLK